jgi:hypothetical protein
MTTFKTKPNDKHMWAGLSRQTIDFQYAIGELVDNALSATLPKPIGEGNQPATIEIVIEEINDGLIKVQVADAGTGVSKANLCTDEDNIFNLGYRPPKSGAMNEHGFGLKNALALMTSGFTTSFEFISKHKDEANIFLIEGPLQTEMRVTETDLNHWSKNLERIKNRNSGVTIGCIVKKSYFNSLYKRGSNFETMIDRLGEHLGVFFNHYIEKDNEIFLRYKSSGASGWSEHKIPAIPVPFLVNSFSSVEKNMIEIEVDGKKYTAIYTRGLLDQTIKDVDSDRGWPYPLRFHYQGSNMRGGIALTCRKRVLKTGVFDDIWQGKVDISYNNFLGELDLGDGFSTTNNKHDLDPHSEPWERLKNKLQEDQYAPEKQTKKQTEETLRKKLIKNYKTQHNLTEENKPKHKAVWDGGADIDIWFEVNQQSYCIEIKIGKAKVQDAYQLQMYWDGLVEEGKEIKEAHLVADEFSVNVRLAVKKINEKKDLKNNPYNLICKVASDFGFD